MGGVGIGVQLGALTILHSWLQVDYLLATVVAVEIAVIHNFFWHERFTWVDRPVRGPMQSFVRFVKFNACNGAVSIAGNLVLMRMLVGELKFNYVASNLFAIVVCSLVNFLLGDRFVFEAEERPGGDFELRAAELWRLSLRDLPHFWGVTRRANRGYTVDSCYALEWLHFASADLLDRGTRLSPTVSFCPAFACARQSLWQRLILLPILSGNYFWLSRLGNPTLTSQKARR